MKYTIYRLFDYNTGSYVGEEFSNIVEFFEYHRVTTFKHLTYWGWYDTMNAQKPRGLFEFAPRPNRITGNYSIKDEYGKNFLSIPELYDEAKRSGLHPPYNTYIPHYYVWDKRFTPPKRNINKLKSTGWDSNHFRRVRTYSEHSIAALHITEYGESIVRPKRRGRSLPDSWDDLPISKWGNKSWKSLTKRKHQWKYKKD